MQRLLTLALAAVGLVGLGLVGWRLAVHRPFEPAPPLLRAARPHPRDAAPVAKTVGSPVATLPAPLELRIERIRTPPLTGTVNILLAGIDARPGRSGYRTDALLLVVLDPRTRHVGLVSIPRDLLVNLPGQDAVRINTVYLRGVRQGGRATGTGRLRRVVRDVVGLPVSHVVFIDHGGFEQLIDAMGGVPVRVVCPIRDRFLDPRGPGGRLTLELPAGTHWLDGRTALMFARSRHGRGIVDRARRQQAVLLGIRDRLVMLGPRRLGELLPALRETVYTELEALELVRLARWLSRVERARVHGLLLGRHLAPTVLPDGRWVMAPDAEAIAAAMRGLFHAGRPGRRAYRSCPPVDAALSRHRGRRASP